VNRPEPMLTIKQVANRLSCSPALVLGLIHTGQINAIRLGRAFRVEPEELARFLSTRRTGRSDHACREEC
jgi:excisionase family DNA binding protein